MLRRRPVDTDPVELERQALVEQRQALEDLKRQLAERVAAVAEREGELRSAIAEVASGGAPGITLPARPASDAVLSARIAELERRERGVRAREASLAELAPEETTAEHARELAGRAKALERQQLDLEERERRLAAAAAIPRDPDAARLAEIEERLLELHEAERSFVRTQQELAARSEAVAARERLVAQRERELGEQEDGWGTGSGVHELETRLRRLEQQRHAVEEARGFSGGLRKLGQEGTRRRTE